MPRKDTPRFGLAYGWLRGEDWWGDPTSANRVVTDLLLHPAPISNTVTEPPPDAEEGDHYIVPPGALGAWQNRDNSLAMMVEGKWVFVKPTYGLRVRIRSLGIFAWWNGETWEPEAVSPLQDPEIGTRYDVSISVGYGPDPGETLLVLPIVQRMTLPADAPESLATIVSPPSSLVQLAIMRNGSQVGTVTFSASSFNGTINVPSDAVFAQGDRLRVVCPMKLPNRFENFGIVLRMSLV